MMTRNHSFSVLPSWRQNPIQVSAPDQIMALRYAAEIDGRIRPLTGDYRIEGIGTNTLLQTDGYVAVDLIAVNARGAEGGE